MSHHQGVSVPSAQHHLEHPLHLDIHSVIDPPGCALAVSGELDLATADSLRDAIRFQLKRGNHTFTLDLAGVSFMDSSGMHALAWALIEIQRCGGTLTVTTVSAPVTRLMRIMGAAELLQSSDPRT